jgi:DNA-binding NtrC family response regulator
MTARPLGAARRSPVAAKRPVAARSAIVVSADAARRERLGESLRRLGWEVREAVGGAAAIAEIEVREPEAMLLDCWLPDLEVDEFAEHVGLHYPEITLLAADGVCGMRAGSRSLRENELLQAVRQAETDGSAAGQRPSRRGTAADRRGTRLDTNGGLTDGSLTGKITVTNGKVLSRMVAASEALEELVGESNAMRDLTDLIRMVAPRTTAVLIEGETGTGKELVARAVHRLSLRADKPFVVLNCAAIPEFLLEAELFGHTRGAFTGAVQARTGRIAAANGGTLFLDEIGELPQTVQAKMLRFLESGEIQRVGDNETVFADVRVIAATHQRLERKAAAGTFRLDLYHRLAVFPIEVPPLRARLEDVPKLAEHFLGLLGEAMPLKRLSAPALASLCSHTWPGNVRELMHVLERAAILSGQRPVIEDEDVRYRRDSRE